MLRLLDHDVVDGTNFLAEREIRPAVVVRKLTAGSRTEVGAETHAALMSVLRACARRGREILGAPTALLRRGPGHILALDHAAATAHSRRCSQISGIREWVRMLSPVRAPPSTARHRHAIQSIN